MNVRQVAVAVSATAAVALTGVAPAHAAADTTPPSLKLQPWGHYKVGTTVFTDYDTSDPSNPYLDYWSASYVLTWKAADPSGICGQTITEQSYDTLGGDEDPVLGSDTVTSPLRPAARSYAYGTDWMDWMRVPDRYVVRATDCAGNTATSGIANTSFGITEDSSSAISYSSGWSVSRFPGFSGGTTHRTTTRGASASITVSGGPVALVMEKASDRGSADVYVDGVRRATVNTHATTTKHRVVVWEALLGSGSHTIRVVNKATAGHPRIDLDAVLNPGGAS